MTSSHIVAIAGGSASGKTTKMYAAEVVSGEGWEGPFVEALWARITAQCKFKTSF